MKTLLLLFATFFLILASVPVQANAERLTVEKEHVPEANRRLLKEANKYTGKVNVAAGATDTRDQTINKVDAVTETKTTSSNAANSDDGERNPNYQYGNTPETIGNPHRDPVCANYNEFKAGKKCRR
ncbi:hypothetical protein CJ030_MR0G002579 [Morella rubra]|uniref:Uncharacterized protein n=1 Tax=Morella rubra TaxID=262757 RepID=A0A6A1UMI3_9ROSI|nr:hypothetical protein CJ030_MR0G002579 [Morella rubra]